MPRSTTPRKRDTQQSRVYAWESAACVALGTSHECAEFATLAECEAFALPIWRAERGRVGLAGSVAPRVERPSWGPTSAMAHHDHRITLPRWARNRWVILHELAHRLVPDRSKDAGHGPRFVGVLIGLLARHVGLDADLLMRTAAEAGVEFHVRSVGMVPVVNLSARVARVLRVHGPMTEGDLAAFLNVGEGTPCSVFQVRGAVLGLVRAGQVQRWRGRLRVPPPAAPPAPTAGTVQKLAGFAALRASAAAAGITVEKDGPGSYWVTCDRFRDDFGDPTDGDPFADDHWCASIGEARDKVAGYVKALQQ